MTRLLRLHPAILRNLIPPLSWEVRKRVSNKSFIVKLLVLIKFNIQVASWGHNISKFVFGNTTLYIIIIDQIICNIKRSIYACKCAWKMLVILRKVSKFATSNNKNIVIIIFCLKMFWVTYLILVLITSYFIKTTK